MSANRKEMIILKRLQEENNELRKQLDNSQRAIKTSEAIETLIAFVKNQKEPFVNTKEANNPFIKDRSFSCF